MTTPLPADTQRRRRGHRFMPTATERRSWPSEDARALPATQRTIRVHYFMGGHDWFICGFDTEDPDLAYGFTIVGADISQAEWGDNSLPELETYSGHPPLRMVIERDCYWKPVPFPKALANWHRSHCPTARANVGGITYHLCDSFRSPDGRIWTAVPGMTQDPRYPDYRGWFLAPDRHPTAPTPLPLVARLTLEPLHGDMAGLGPVGA